MYFQENLIVSKETELKNVASERAVLAGLLQHGKECFLEVELFVNEDSFRHYQILLEIHPSQI